MSNNVNLHNSNFSLWCDFIERKFLNNEFKDLIDNSVIYGATSNPSIFADSILNSVEYKKDKDKLKNLTPFEIYEKLAFEDIKTAAKSLLPLWNKNKNDGFISIEIDPRICDNAPLSIDEGRRIFKIIDMPNVMIKVPATKAGFEVMNALYIDGINVNATLVFSPNQVKESLFAFGNNENNLNTAKAVISVFVSRFDRAINIKDSAPKLGIYNASKCYNMIESFNNPNIRTLFASTGVKDDFIDSLYYISNLLFKNSINTAPLKTIKDFINKDFKITKPQDCIDSYLEDFNKNMNLDSLYSKLLDNGLDIFIESFENMLLKI